MSSAPDQRIRDGVVELRVAEGRLAGLNARAPRGAGWVRRRLERVTRGVLDVKALQNELALLQQAPWVERVDALLVPAGEPGSTHLEVQLAERPAFYTALRLANDRTPAIGSLTRELEVGHENLTGSGDVASERLGQTEGLLEWQLDYRVPLGGSDFLFALAAERSRADVAMRSDAVGAGSGGSSDARAAAAHTSASASAAVRITARSRSARTAPGRQGGDARGSRAARAVRAAARGRADRDAGVDGRGTGGQAQ